MLQKILRVSRHPLRGLAFGLAAFALTVGVGMTEGIVSGVLGAVLGVVLGERLGRGKYKLVAIVGGSVAVALLVALITGAIVRFEAIPELVGPGTSLRIAGILRYGVYALAFVTALRAVAVRKPTAMALELGAVVASLATALAAHRDGVIARPLWLSDWAWQVGLDPTDVLLTIGGVSVVLLAILLVAESKKETSIASLIWLPLLALLAVLFFNVNGLPKPPSNAGDLGLINPPGQEPHELPPIDAGHPGGHSPSNRDGGGGNGGQPGQDGGGGGQRPDTGDGGASGNDGGGEGGQQSSRDGGGEGGGATDGGAGGSQRDASTDGGAGGGGDGSMDGGTGGGGGDGSTDGGGGGGGGEGGQGGGGEGGVDSGFNWPDLGQMPSVPPQNPSQGGQGGQQTTQQNQDDNNDPSRGGSPAPMAIVVLDDDYSPPSGAYYFRQEAWSEYNGSRLVETTRDDVDLDTNQDFPTALTHVRDPAPHFGRTLVHATVSLLIDHKRPFALESPDTFAPAANPNPARFLRSYRTSSWSQTLDYRRLVGRAVGDHRWTPEVRQYYLHGPEDPRYAELAQQIVSHLPPARRHDPFAQAVAVKLWLDHNATYSTRERHAGVPDPTADFLFGNKIGYCVHFAHAAVYMWRSLGIPARVSTGYHFDEANRRGGSAILLRGSDGHAWPEIYFDGVGWIVLDIAAEKNLDPPGDPPDDDLQRMLGEMARQQPPDPMNTEPPKPHPPTHYWKDASIVAGVLAALALLLVYCVKLWRRIAPTFTPRSALPRIAYRAALDKLADAGVTREPGETREAFADRVGSYAPSFRKLTDWAVAVKLRPTPLPEMEPATIRATLRATRREIPKGSKLWRRLLGLVNPVSFLQSR